MYKRQGQHGVATATAAALLGLECEVYMGKEDTDRQALNVFRMELLGARVHPVTSGTQTLKAVSYTHLFMFVYVIFYVRSSSYTTSSRHICQYYFSFFRLFFCFFHFLLFVCVRSHKMFCFVPFDGPNAFRQRGRNTGEIFFYIFLEINIDISDSISYTVAKQIDKPMSRSK